MDFVVCLKQSVDLQQVRIKKETRTPVLEGIPFVFGDMDKNALEEAVKTKEKLAAGKVIVLSMGFAKLRDTIKDALARGAASHRGADLRRVRLQRRAAVAGPRSAWDSRCH